MKNAPAATSAAGAKRRIIPAISADPVGAEPIEPPPPAAAGRLILSFIALARAANCSLRADSIPPPAGKKSFIA
jgi:hypothetical protein